MKDRPSRLDWFAFYPSDFVNSPDVVKMSSAARGAYISILSHCWLNADNGCSIPNDEEYILRITNCNRKQWSAIKDQVLPKFDLDRFNSYLTNARLGRELAQVRSESAAQQLAASARWEPNPLKNQQKKDANALHVQSQSNANGMPKQNSTVQDSRVQDRHETVGDILGQVEQPTLVGIDSNGKKKGDPGYYERGQYPGTDPKKIFKFMQEKWCSVKGEAAYARYPNKFPEPWTNLCDAVSSDLIVPAFELWCDREGRYMNTAWPVSEFLRVVEKYMAEVKPLNETRPKISKEQMEATTALAKKQHEETWGSIDAKPIDDADPLSMLEETN